MSTSWAEVNPQWCFILIAQQILKLIWKYIVNIHSTDLKHKTKSLLPIPNNQVFFLLVSRRSSSQFLFNISCVLGFYFKL